jgi:hypothetical protein
LCHRANAGQQALRLIRTALGVNDHDAAVGHYESGIRAAFGSATGVTQDRVDAARERDGRIRRRFGERADQQRERDQVVANRTSADW